MEEEDDQQQTSSRSQHYQLDPLIHIFPIESMKDVVATVSGYHGVERFNLIKLIAHSGASYVGNMSKSITHLVCWKFEGKKYELAKKHKTVVVNHQWIEDCIKQGKRLLEHPYVTQSGQDVGPISLEDPLVVKACASNKKMVSDNSNHVHTGKSIRLGSQTFSNPVWTDSFLINENVIPGSQKTGDLSCKSKRQIRKNSNKEKQSRTRCSTADNHFSNQDSLKHKESSSYVSEHMVRDKRKISNVDVASASASTNFSCKRRRLVKKNADREGLGLQALDAGPGCNINTIQRQHSNDPAHSHSSNDMKDTNVIEIREEADEWMYSQSRVVDESYGYGDVMEMNNEESPDPIKKTSKGIFFGVEKSGDINSGSHPDYAARALTSPELSCVICWTDFSSTRGILSCGHRFCYSCIQEWADHMASSSRALTCPLCKASFTNIMKVEGAELTDQSVFSQTIPCDASISEIMILRDQATPYVSGQSSSTVICCVCLSREPEDMLIRCHFCQNRQIHSYCLDPYLLPWACSQCKNLQMLYYRSR